MKKQYRWTIGSFQKNVWGIPDDWSGEDIGDYDANNDYQPSKYDVNLSDSNISDSSESKLNQKKRQAWKKKKTTIKRKLFKPKYTQ